MTLDNLRRVTTEKDGEPITIIEGAPWVSTTTEQLDDESGAAVTEESSNSGSDIRQLRVVEMSEGNQDPDIITLEELR